MFTHTTVVFFRAHVLEEEIRKDQDCFFSFRYFLPSIFRNIVALRAGYAFITSAIAEQPPAVFSFHQARFEYFRSPWAITEKKK